MARSKKPEWISGKEAARILTSHADHTVSMDYVRVLAKKGLIRSQPIDGRTNEYHRRDVEEYIVERRSSKREETHAA